ncbi:hypothetical protein S40285_00900 [Stachybotrys chlorohalonatus IBT 40285]|uniref:tRNA (guanine(26)-N(2))-dimethyltransferase n=1 Tax=Stachybotrys chlorohalonatus (strain IBT 40285) TaxID=1283841 RepID=A0A084QUX1_STAC4|nr:hypothetical protein S40285_00900 [Stachybotrys chlorohalonata IBT 40285]
MSAPTVPVDIVRKDGSDYRAIKEGKATILVPHGAKIGEDRKEVQQVFYNPIQQYNRDLSVLAIKTYGEQRSEEREQARRLRNQKLALKNAKKRKREHEPTPDELPAELGPKVEVTNAPEEPRVQDSSKATHPFKIFDALSASGLRALRYAHELPFVTEVVANDLSESAAKTIQFNVAHNGLEDKIKVTNEDALAYLYRNIADGLSKRDRRGEPIKGNQFDVIDLDPYGTAAPFFDAAVQAVRQDGGLLCITCTDSALWAGHSYCEKTFALYGGIPVHGGFTHEAGLRLILNAVATSAARYGLTIEPQLSLSIDFYTKLFVKVTKSQHAVKFLAAKTMLLYNCDAGCGSWYTQPLMKAKETPNKNGTGTFFKHVMAQGPGSDRKCDHCGWRMHINGPMYAGHIHSQDFVKRMLKQIPEADPATYGTLKRLEGMLQTVLDEYIPSQEQQEHGEPLEGDLALAECDRTPFYIHPSRLAKTLACPIPPFNTLRGAILHLGYQAGRSHCSPGSIKTDAPWSVIWHIMTEWIRQKAPLKPGRVKPSLARWKILNDAGLIPEHEADEENEKAEEGEKKDQVEEEGDQVMEHGLDESTGAKSNEANGNEASDTYPSLASKLLFNSELEHKGRLSKGPKISRYQQNPTANWGPLTKASRH